jgi:hypothetical protein
MARRGLPTAQDGLNMPFLDEFRQAVRPAGA